MLAVVFYSFLKFKIMSQVEKNLAHQSVIDSLNDRDITGEIQEAFDNYVSLVEQQDKKTKSELLDFIEKNSWGDDTGRLLIDASDLYCFINGG